MTVPSARDPMTHAATDAASTRDRNLELVRALYRAVELGDHDGIRRQLADDLRWRQAGSAVPAAGEVLAGPDTLLDRVIQPIEDTWDGFSEEIHELIAGDGHVVALGRYHGRHRESGATLEAEFCHLWEVDGERIRGFRQFTDTARFAAILGME